MSNVIKRDIEWVVDDVTGLIQGYQRMGATGQIEFTPMPMGRSEVASRGGSILRRGFPLLRCPDTLDRVSSTGSAAANGVYLGGGGGTSPLVEIVQRNGRNCLQITLAPNNEQVATVAWRIPSGVRTANQHVVYEVEDMAEMNGGYINLRLTTDVNINVGMECQRTIGRSNGWNGLHCFAPKASQWTAIGGGSFASTMTYAVMRFFRKSNPTGTTRIWVYEWAEGEKQSLPQIIFGFDDGHITSERGINILQNDGWKPYGAYICDGQDGVTRMRDNVEWARMAAQGVEICVHGPLNGYNNYAEYLSNYTGFSSPQAAIENDINTHIRRMVSAGLDPTGMGRQICVLPQGVHNPSGAAGNDTVYRAMKNCGIKMCRRADTEGQILINGGGAGAMMYLPIIGHNYAGSAPAEVTNISNLITAVDTAITAGMSVIFMLHIVRDTPTISMEIAATDLQTLSRTFLGYCQAGRARQGSIFQLFQELQSYDSPVHMS